jgi:gluconokinase
MEKNLPSRGPSGEAINPVRILLVMGAAGSGKSTLGRLLAQDLGWPFYDGDDFHPKGNVDKMAQGMALNDQDRLPWLRALHDLMAGILDQPPGSETPARSGAPAARVPQPQGSHGHGILACSALKQSYRDVLMGGLDGVGLVYIKGSYALLEARLKGRKDHYFKSELLATQFEVLEEPEDAVVVDAGADSGSQSLQVRRAFRLGPRA